MSEFKLARFKHTWLSEWLPAARYNPDDIISYGGKVYVCLVSHTASPDFYSDLNFYNTDIPPLAVPRWELVSEGTSWKGDWVSDFYYKIGDVIKFAGVIYQCIEGHTSSSRYVFDPDTESLIINPADPTGEKKFASVDYVYWTVQVTSNNWQGDWNIETYYKLNDVVRYGGRTYRCIKSHLSTGTVVAGLEADIDQWEIVNIADQWKNSWNISTKYIVNDVVRYNGFVYRCNTPHISTSSVTLGLDADLDKWDELHKSTEYHETWQPGTLYHINDIVKYGSYVWKCNALHISSPSFDTPNFEIFTPGQEFDVEWNEKTIYQEGDVVGYGGDIYYAKSLNFNVAPSQSEITWQPLFRSSKMLGEWDPLQPYRTGDVVNYGGNIYLALIDSFAQTPDLQNDGSSTNSIFWDLVIPGSRWRGIWSLDITYSTGDTVSWGPNSYRCIDSHLSSNLNRPDDDSNGLTWSIIVKGNDLARLSEIGDMKTFGPNSDSTVDLKRLSAGNKGDVIRVSATSEPEWAPLWSTDKVYYVSLNGRDIPTAGITPENPWRTIRYALEHVTGPATIFVRTGVFEEVLPLRVPPYVAIVGDELRGTIVKPALGAITPTHVNLVVEAFNYIYGIIKYIINEDVIGTTDPTAPAFGTKLYGEVPQNFSGTVGSLDGKIIAETLIQQFIGRVTEVSSTSLSGSNDPTTQTGILASRQQIINNKEFIKNEVTLYVENVFTDSTITDLPESWSIDLDRVIDAILYDMLYPGNYKTTNAADYFINAADGNANKRQDMFLFADATGLRNLSLYGLEGELTGINSYGTRRVTAGAYASLDPGWGPSDNSVWVLTRSPYIQNVTTFGDRCIGMKVDGDIHGGGNQTMVANDFTQILSDGIGMWCNGSGRAELVSVFVYYNHIGYLCTNGGKIRGTNGNCSYGTFGAVSEGVNIGETPITGSVNNKYYEADVAQAFCNDSFQIMKLFFSNAGVEYTSGTMSVTGSGGNANLLMDEFRDGAVYEVRITNFGDSSAEGGSGYVFTTNVSQGGDDKTIIISGSDENTPEVYRGMRVLIPAGTGAGQYGYVAEYDEALKTVIVGKDSHPYVAVEQTYSLGNIMKVSSTEKLKVNDPVVFTGEKYGNIRDNSIYYVKSIESSTTITLSATPGGVVFNLINGTGAMLMHHVGWDHFVEGSAIHEALDTTTNYVIEPKITFSSPGISTVSTSLGDHAWVSVAANNDRWVMIATGSDVVSYTSNGSTFNSTTLPSSTTWTKVRYVGGMFIALASDGTAASSADGTSWSSITMPSASAWSDVAYGAGTWVAVAIGTNATAYSTDGITWNAGTLPSSGDWSAIAYGKGRFVAIDSTGNSTTSTNGTTWADLTVMTTPMASLTYGDNKFVAVATGAGATGTAVSFDGSTWLVGSLQAADWQDIEYAQGIFFAVASGTANASMSKDGIHWDTVDLGNSTTWCSVSFATTSKPGKFLATSGKTGSSTIGKLISTGATTKARPVVVAGRISEIRIWEPGSGYTSPPVMTIIDPNNTSEVSTSVRIGNGVIANPTILDAGTGYETTSTRVTITGDGYKDQYQLGSFLVCDNVSRLPGPGDNLTITGINDYVYKVLSHTILGGSLGDYTLRLNIAKDLGREETPEHGTAIEIRQLYSQVRLTGHDFLEIGLGNFIQTNYPDTLNSIGTVLAPEDEVRESGGGRVFYTSTDQDGNFRVGELFAVEQATGTVTLNAQFFELQGLEELRLGGVTVGGTGVVVREFSTDGTFTADSNNIVPTQRAIKAYIQRRVSGGGADAITASMVAGLVQVGPNLISTTSGDEVRFPVVVNFKGGIDGTYLAQTVFMSMF